MAAPYTEPSISGYNSNPPSDDGAQTEANRVKWATITGKLSGPLKTYADAINSAITSAFGKSPGGAGVTSTGISYTVQSSDQGKTVVATAAGITITTPDATSVESPFGFHLVNTSSGTVTLDGSGSQTVDGNTTISIPTTRGMWIETDGANWFTGGVNFDLVPQLPRGYMGGLKLSQPLLSGVPDDHDITIAAGEARGSTNTLNLNLTSSLTKQIDASWAAGDDAGGMASGVSLSPDTWYHLFLVDDGAGGTDAVFDTSITCANGLATTGIGTEYRRVGSVLTDGSSNILPFEQIADEFIFMTPPNLDVDVASPGTSRTTATLTVPPGVEVQAIIRVLLNASANAAFGMINLYRTTLDEQAPSSTALPLATLLGSDSANVDYHGAEVRVITNTSAQISYQCASASNLHIAAIAWRDFLGRYD